MPERKAPDFTIRQNGGGSTGSATATTVSRAGRPPRAGTRTGPGPSRFGSPRQGSGFGSSSRQGGQPGSNRQRPGNRQAALAGQRGGRPGPRSAAIDQDRAAARSADGSVGPQSPVFSPQCSSHDRFHGQARTHRRCRQQAFDRVGDRAGNRATRGAPGADLSGPLRRTRATICRRGSSSRRSCCRAT